MSQYTSYYLYQKYEKRGDQDWIPCYPNEYSTDADGTKPLVIKRDADVKCGFQSGGTDDFTYEEWRVTDDYICDDGNKYQKLRRYVSWDDELYVETNIYKRGELIESNSTDCGWDESYSAYTEWVWINEGDTICEGADKYQYLRKYFRNGDQYVVSNIYARGELIEQNSVDCGYVYGRKQYRWVQMDISTDYYCGDFDAVKHPSNAKAMVCTTSNHNIGYLIFGDGTSIEFTETQDYKTIARYIRIFDTVDAVDYNAFYGFSVLSEIDFGNGVTNIAYQSFNECTALTSLTIPNQVTRIGHEVFIGCTSLAEVHIGSGITNIGNRNFQGCTALTTFEITATTPPTIGSYLFDESSMPDIYVPSQSVSAYQTASGWSQYSSKIRAIQN